MPSLIVAKSFFERFASLSKPVQADVTRLLDKFDDMSRSKSLHLEPIKGALDPNVRTVRVNQGIRGIVAAPKGGETFVLIDVLPHDEATKWCLRKRLNVNDVTGALEIYDVAEVPGVEDTNGPSHGPPSLFAKRSDDDFTSLGIDSLLLPAIRALQYDHQVQALLRSLPPVQGQALEMLAAGYTVEDALAELLAEAPTPVAKKDVDIGEAAMSAASSSAFYVVENASALAAALNAPLEHWRLFLHPMQKSLAYREEFKGPARVLGGPGTGKTVVALHRAAFLAGRSDSGARILLTTFTKSLAKALGDQLGLLDKPGTEKIDVDNVDALAYRIVKTVERRSPRIVSDSNILPYCEDIIRENSLECSASFLRREWESVILAIGVRSRDEYFTAQRAGRGIRLSRSSRAQYWTAIESLLRRLDESGERTYLQIAYDAMEYVKAGEFPKFAHVLVDEAQDLHAIQWRLLRALVAEGPNDMFIVGDPHQRIYDNRVALNAVGISVRGRSSRLRLNYRTTFEILKWSLGMLEGVTVDDLDDSVDDLKGYRSLSHGPEPIIAGSDSAATERAGLKDAIAQWAAMGVPYAAMGVAARTVTLAKEAASVLKASGIPIRFLGDQGAESNGVTVGTMHSMKGLEFRAVAVVGANAGILPHEAAVTSKEEDPLQHGFDVLRERCLFFVACTRARDLLRVSWYGEPSQFLGRGTFPAQTADTVRQQIVAKAPESLAASIHDGKGEANRAASLAGSHADNTRTTHPFPQKQHSVMPPNFWHSDHFDFSDSLNEEIWTSSPDVQEQIQPVATLDASGVIGAQQGMRGRSDMTSRRSLPWVPDLIGKNWQEKTSLVVVGSAYAGFIREYSTRETAMSFEQYASAASVEEFQRLFLSHVVREDPNYYNPIASLCADVGDASNVSMVDLCRASLVKRGIGDTRRADSSSRVVNEAPSIFEKYVESPIAAEWLWRRFVQAEAHTVIALGSTVEHGLLRLFVRRGMTASQAGRSFSPAPFANGGWVNEYADSNKKLSYWLRHQTWWSVSGVVNGRTREWPN